MSSTSLKRAEVGGTGASEAQRPHSSTTTELREPGASRPAPKAELVYPDPTSDPRHPQGAPSTLEARPERTGSVDILAKRAEAPRRGPVRQRRLNHEPGKVNRLERPAMASIADRLTRAANSIRGRFPERFAVAGEA